MKLCSTAQSAFDFNMPKLLGIKFHAAQHDKWLPPDVGEEGCGLTLHVLICNSMQMLKTDSHIMMRGSQP